MNRRRLRLAAALAALAIIGSSLSCGGGTGSRRDSLAIDPALLAMVPSDTVMLAGGRWDRVVKSPLYAKLEPMLPGDGPGGLRERLGSNPQTDLREFLLAFNGKEPLALSRVTVDTKALLERLSKEGSLERSEHKGRPILGRGGMGVAFVSEGVLAAGRTAQLEAAIDATAAGGGKSSAPARLTAALTALPSAAGVYFASMGGATLNLRPGSNLGNVDKVLASLDLVSAFGDFSQGVKVAATGQGVDAEAAKRLHTQLRGLIGMGRLSTPDDQRDLLKLFDAIRTSQEDKTIRLEAALTVEQAEQLLTLVGGARAGR